METNNLKQESNTEISFIDLLESSKKCIKSEDIKSSLYYLNIALFSPALDLSSKIARLSLSSLAHFKLKNEEMLIRIVRKLFKYSRKHNLNSIQPEILLIYVKILLKASQLMEDNENFLYSCWFLYYAKVIYDGNNLKEDDSSYVQIKSGFPKLMKKISDNLTEISEGLLKKRDRLNNILEYFSKREQQEIKIKINQPDEVFYLVSSTWISNTIFFIRNILEPSNEIENIFGINNVCLLYFEKTDEEDEEVRREILGSYSGPINNFLLTSGCEFWADPEETYTNSYVDKEIRENSDYLLIPKEIYLEMKDTFGVFNEIERRSALIDNQFTVEVNLKKIKVLFINESLRDRHKDLIKPKNIQISKYSTCAQLENKLKRIFKNLLDNENVDYDFRIYKYEREIREIFELIVSYCNKNKSYKIIVKEVKKSENSQKTIADLKIGNKDILIVEAIPKNMIIKPFIRVASETLNCSLCNAKIDSNSTIPCDNCTQNIYCSSKCKSNDLVHSEYHKKISSLFRKKLTLSEISEINIESLLDANSKCGLVGLKNLGNTCFMSSTIQCLSNCEELTKYFLSKAFLDDLNVQSKQGVEAKLVKAYYDLLHEMWIGSNDAFSPWEFKNVLVSNVKQHAGLQNVDFQEIVLFILGKLHEDLNRARDAKSSENFRLIKGEPEEEESKRWWNAYKSKSDSVILDLFGGFMKTNIKCSGCKVDSSSYDPFMFLPLPIPDKNISKVRFKVFPNNLNFKYFTVEVFDVSKTTTVKEIKNKIKENISYRIAEFDALLLKNKYMDSVLSDDDSIYDLVFTRIDFSQEEFIDHELIFCEVENSSLSKNKGDYVTFYISPSDFFEEKYYLLLKYKKFRPLCYPKAFSISKKSRVKDLYIEVYKYYRRAMNDMVVVDSENKFDTSYYEEFYNNIKNKEFIEKDFDKLFMGMEASGNLDETSDQNKLEMNANKKENSHFELFFYNNIPNSQSYFSRKPACEYCNSRCEYCKWNLSLNVKIYELYAMQKDYRPFFIMSDFSQFRDGFYKFFEEFVDTSDPQHLYKGELTIYDCFDQNRKEEKLEKDTWKCEYCEKSLAASKKVELCSAPKYLIVQFKRFKLKGYKSLTELVNNKKNETFMYYPINDLNLSNYFTGSNKDATYELIAVTQHTGGLKDGHYTATVKNKDKWFNFDDETITEAKYSDIMNQNAYILYYKKVINVKKTESEGNMDNSINSTFEN